MAKGNALRAGFKNTAAELGPVKHEFSPSHVGIVHAPHPEHTTSHNDNTHTAAHNGAHAGAHAGAQHDAANYTSMGHFIAWLRETRAFQHATTKINDLMRKGLMKTMSYLDVNGILGREASNTPSRNPLGAGKPMFDGPEPE